MSVTKIEKEELSSTVTELKSTIDSLKGQKDTLASALSGANDYDGINISGAASTLSGNLDAVIKDLETVQKNMDGYITKVSELDTDDFSSGGGSGGGSRNYSGGASYSGGYSGGGSYSSGGGVTYSSTGSQPGGEVKALGDSTEITLPSGLGVVKTYMGWQCITAKNSQQYKLIEAAGMNFDSEGFGKIGDRYVIATTTTYGQVGDYLDVVQADGTVLKCIIGDIKNQNDAGCNKWGHMNGQCVVEFVVDKNSWYSGGKGSHANPGTANCHPEWHQGVTKIINRGNYFTNPKGPATTTTSSSNQDITSIEMSTGAAVNYSVGTKTTTSTASKAASNVANVDISKYHNNTSAGFEVTTGNKTYNLNSNDYDLLCAIVSAESDKGYDDALAVTTTILNRCETSNWVTSYGTDPIKQATAPNQFVVYQEGHYKKFTNGNAPDEVKQAVMDALNGVRNHDYLSFRSNSSSGYSSNMISSTGNRYK